MLQLIGREWQLLLFGFLMSFGSAPGQTFFISLFSHEIRAELALSDGAFGAAYSFATLASAAVMVWSGALVDRVDLRVFSAVVITGLGLGCGLLFASHTVVVLVLGLFLLRHAGQGLMCLAGSTALVRYLERERGRATAIGGLGYPVSEAVLPALVVAALALVGWRMTWLLVAVAVPLVLVPAVTWLLRGHGERHARWHRALPADDAPAGAGPRVHWRRGEVLRDRRFYLFLPALTGQQLLFTGYIFHQVRLVEAKGWSLAVWASLFSLYAVTSVAAKLASGGLVDRFGAARLVPLMLLPLGLGLVLLAWGDAVGWGGVFLVLTGITVGTASTVSPPFWAELYGTRHLGAIKSLAAALMVLFTGLSPVALGVLIDAGVGMDRLVLGGAIYVLAASALAVCALAVPPADRP